MPNDKVSASPDGLPSSAMTAPPSAAPEIRRGWLESMETVDRQLHMCRMFRTVFTEVRDALIEKDRKRGRPLPGHFIVCYADNYWDSQVVAIRRLTDADDRTYSLRNLIRKVSVNAHLLPGREDFIDEILSKLEWEETDRERAAIGRDVDQRIFGGDPTVPSLFFESLVTKMTSDTTTIVGHVDTWVAHRDMNTKLEDFPVTFVMIHRALKTLEEVAGAMHYLLFGSQMLYESLVMPSGWQQPLKTPVFEPMSEFERYFIEHGEAPPVDWRDLES